MVKMEVDEATVVAAKNAATASLGNERPPHLLMTPRYRFAETALAAPSLPPTAPV